MTAPSIGTPWTDSFQPISARARPCPRASAAIEREVAEAGDAGRGAVPALRLRADDGLVDPARTALEDLAVLVDEEVVADVVPAVAVAVVAGDAEHDRRPSPPARSRWRSRCGARTPCWTSPYSGGSRGGTESAPHALRGMIGGGAPGLRARAARPRRRAAADAARCRAVGSARTKRARSARGVPRRRSWNSSAAPTNAGSVPAGTRPRSGPWSPMACSVAHARPAAAAAAGADLRLGVRAARPAQADQVEAPRRAQHAGRAPAARAAAAARRRTRRDRARTARSAARRAPARRGAGRRRRRRARRPGAPACG